MPRSADPSGGPREFADLSGWRKVAVSGTDVLAWLGALVDADLSDLGPGRALHGRLPTPAGAGTPVTVAVPGGSLLVVQDPTHSRDAHAALVERAATGGDITIEDRTADLVLFAFPGRTAAPDAAGSAATTPSCLGTGIDLFALAEDHDRLLRSLGRRFELIDDVERWRADR